MRIDLFWEIQIFSKPNLWKWLLCICIAVSYATTSSLNVCFNFEAASTELCSKCSLEGSAPLPAFVQCVWFEGYFHKLPLLFSRSVSMSLAMSSLCLTHSLAQYEHGRYKIQLLLITAPYNRDCLASSLVPHINGKEIASFLYLLLVVLIIYFNLV